MKKMKKLVLASVVVLLLLVFAEISYSQDTEGIGVVSAYQGSVQVTRGEDTQNASQGMEVLLGDIFDTAEESGVKIVFIDDTLVALGEDTTFEITEFVFNPDERRSVSNVTRGKMRSLINKFKGATSSVEYKTSNAVAGVKGTELYVNADDEIFAVREGEAFVRGLLPGAREVRLGANQFTRIINGSPIDPQLLTDEIWSEILSKTDFPEQLLDLFAIYDQYFPGQNIPPAFTKSGSFSSTAEEYVPGIELPTVPPVDLTPGAGFENGVPVEIVIPGLN